MKIKYVSKYKKTITFHLDITYELVSEKSRCKGGARSVGMNALRECARICDLNLSLLFLVARQDSGYCNGDKCKCYCYPDLYQDGMCPQEYWSNDDLYRIKHW